MGYYTQYEMRVHGLSESAAAAALCALDEFCWERQRAESEASGKTASGFGVVVSAAPVWPSIESLFEEARKWYDWETDMICLSRKFPDVTWELHGSGEESGDKWVAYFKNGDCQVFRQAEWVPPACPWALVDAATVS